MAEDIKVYILCLDTFTYDDGGLLIISVHRSTEGAVAAGNEYLVKAKSSNRFIKIDDEPRIDSSAFMHITELDLEG